MSLSTWADEAVFNFNTNGLTMFDGITAVSTSSTHDGDITTTVSTTVNGVTLTVSPSGANTPNRFWKDYNLNAVQLRLYGGTLGFSAPEGKVITGLTFDTSTWNDPTASTGLVSENRWSGQAASLTLTIDGQLRINSITVTYGEGGEVVIDPDAVQVDSLQKIQDLTDGTLFQFTTESYVNYRNGKYLYLQQHNADGDCYVALIYGDLDKDYQMGDIIPAGWKGKKSTYKTLVEVTDATGMADANGQISSYYTQPFDYTGYMTYIDESMVNYKVLLTGTTISNINGNYFDITATEDGNTITLQGFNKFDIDLTEGGFDIEAMVSIYDGNVQLYPIGLKKTEMLMWKIWYYGEDGMQCTVADDIYVDYIDNENKLIYVTDNATTVLWDEYADWGLTWDEPWTPDWAAIDCGNNDDLFNAIKNMSIIKGGTLDITLQDNNTNPRFIVANMPQAGQGQKPEIAYRNVMLTDTLNSNGREVLFITGTYNDGKLEGTIQASGVNQAIELYAEGEAGNTDFINGAEYLVKAYIIQKEAWEDSQAGAPALKKGAKAAATKRSHRRMPIDSPAWFTNYEIHAFQATQLSATAITDIETAKATSQVTYVNAAGQTSNTPFHGVNIVVTRRADGSQTITKVIK